MSFGDVRFLNKMETVTLSMKAFGNAQMKNVLFSRIWSLNFQQFN